MKLKPILVVLAALALGLSAGYLVRNVAWVQSSSASIKKGDFTQLYTKTGAPVILYSLSTCLHCKHARNLLERNKVHFVERVIDNSSEAKQEAVALQAKRVPFLLIGNFSIEGYDEDKILELLDREHKR